MSGKKIGRRGFAKGKISEFMTSLLLCVCTDVSSLVPLPSGGSLATNKGLARGEQRARLMDGSPCPEQWGQPRSHPR